MLPDYVLITAARNEEAHIGRLLESMVAQTLPPLAWVIVSDGSVDRTDEIVSSYREQYPWIRLLHRPKREARSFAAKVECFDAGRDLLRDLPYGIIGNLDADLSFGPDYFEFLIGKFADNPELGVAGTPFVENGRHYDYRFTNIEHVSGACQLFRRECFADIGGYVPIKGGGIDWVAVTTARMKGWHTRTFTEKHCLHHRPIGTGSGGFVTAAFRQGRKDYYLGGHPLWQVVRGLYQMARPPYVVVGACLVAGYVWGWLMRDGRPIPAEVVRFHRGEQMRRLRRVFGRQPEGVHT